MPLMRAATIDASGATFGINDEAAAQAHQVEGEVGECPRGHARTEEYRRQRGGGKRRSCRSRRLRGQASHQDAPPCRTTIGAETSAVVTPAGRADGAKILASGERR